MKKSIFLFGTALLSAFSIQAQTPTTPSVSEPVVVKHTISRIMEKTINGKNWELTLNNDEVADLKLNGKKMPKSTWTKYQAEIDNLRSAALEMDPEVMKDNKNTTTKVHDVLLSDSGDLTPEQKATHKAIEDELMNDKLINERVYKLTLTENSMLVNGKTMSKEVTDKYIILYYTYSGEQRCEGCRFKIQMDKKAN